MSADEPTADPTVTSPGAVDRMRAGMARMGEVGTPRREAVRRLAAAMRLANERLVRSNADADAIDEVAAAVERAVALLGEGPLNRPYEGFSEPSLAGSLSDDGNDRTFFEYSPLFGKGNALAPPLEMRVEDDAVHASAVFTAPYEGPPGHVHGGFIAASFDEVLGMAQSLTGNPGMTGRLTIHYRSPTPLYQPLVLKAWVVSVSGRKILTEATLDTADGRRCAEAEGLFVSIDFSKFAHLLEQRDADAG